MCDRGMLSEKELMKVQHNEVITFFRPDSKYNTALGLKKTASVTLKTTQQIFFNLSISLSLKTDSHNLTTNTMQVLCVMICSDVCCPCSPPARSEAVLQAGGVPFFASQGF